MWAMLYLVPISSQPIFGHGGNELGFRQPLYFYQASEYQKNYITSVAIYRKQNKTKQNKQTNKQKQQFINIRVFYFLNLPRTMNQLQDPDQLMNALLSW
jgi:lipopolysaccharide export LptBFGC system permease protein LptF